MRNPALASLLAVSLLLSCKSGPSGPSGGSGGMPPAGGGEATAGGGAATGTPTAVAGAWRPGAPKKVRTIEGITEYALDNGMIVLLFPDASKDTVTVNATYFVGSRHEGYGETGMAHLLEHMLFKGTKLYGDIWKELETRGAVVNGSTWFDRTNYFETLPATWDNLEYAVRMEADRMVNALIRPEDLASEFSVVRNEFEIGENDPSAILSERMWSTAYLWHNYGKSTIGSRADIEKVPVPALRAFYEKYYQPDNAMLVIAGKFDEAKTLELVNSTFGAIPRPTRKLQPTYTIEPPQDGEREVSLRRTGDVQVVGLMYHSVAGSDADHAAGEAIVDLLTNEPSGRLYKALVETGLASSVSGSAYAFHDPGVIEIYATVKADKPIEPVRAKMIEIVEGLHKGKITDDEIARYRVKQKKEYKLLFTNSQQIALYLSEAAALGDWRMLFIARDHTQKVTTAQAQKFAATYLKKANRTLGTFIPTKPEAIERAPMVEKPNVDLLVKDYQGQPPPSEGEVFVYTIENIEKRTTRGALKNGLKWAFLPKENRGDAVRARLTLRYGTEKDLKGKVEAAEFLGDLLRRGTKKRSFQQIKDEFDALEAQVGFGGQPGALVISITTVRDNLPLVLDLVNEILREPTFPADQLEIMKKESISSLEEQRSDPQQRAFTAFIRKVRPKAKDDVEYTPTPDEKIERVKAVKLADIKALHRLIGASHAQFTVVGDFDSKLIGDKAEALWGAWKSPKPFARIADKHTDVPASEEWIDTPDKEMGLLVFGYPLAMRDDDADYPAMQVANYVLGGGGFTSRLLKRLRQKEGFSYVAFSFMQADPLDAVAILGAGAASAPQNCAKALVAALEEVDLLLSKGIPADELEEAKKGYIKEFERNLSNDGFVLNQLHDGLYIGRTLEFWAGVNAKIAALTPEAVNAVIKKYLKPGAFVKVTAADKKKAEAGGK